MWRAVRDGNHLTTSCPSSLLPCPHLLTAYPPLYPGFKLADLDTPLKYHAQVGPLA